MRMRMRMYLVLLAAGALPFATGCVPATIEVEHHAVYVDRDPPPPKDESELAVDPPADDHVWVTGYWYWNGTGWTWVRGRWARPPVPDHVWVSSGWILLDGRYR